MEPKLHHLPPTVREALEDVTYDLRRRLEVRGWLAFAATTMALLLVGTLLLILTDTMRLGHLHNAIIVSAVLLDVGAAWRWLYRPRRIPLPPREVALFIDQHHPELQNRIVSAVEFGQLSQSHQGRDISLFMIERFLDETAHATRSIPLGREVNPARIGWGKLGAAILSILTLAVFLKVAVHWSPDLSRFREDSAKQAVLQPLKVSPGNVEVRRGDSVVVTAETLDPEIAPTLVWRIEGGDWQSGPMSPSPGARSHHHTFRHIDARHEYRVRMNGITSDTYLITPWEAPAVEAIHAHYTYPDYLNRPDEEVPNAGPISALEGTCVKLDISANKPLSAATLVLKAGERRPLSPLSDTVWSTDLVVTNNDTYYIEVADLEGRPSEFNPSYEITAIRDRAPEVKITFPRGDDDVTSIEEIPFAIDVKDDFGVTGVGIQYEIAGREPVRLTLAESVDLPPLATRGEHTLMLEDLGLTPGDLITWTVWTRDQKPDRDHYETLGDPFFLEVRPFVRIFEEAVSNAGAGQNPQGASPGGSQTTMGQREVLIATWNLRRRAHELNPDEFTTQSQTIIDAQNDLLRQSLERMNAPGQGIDVQMSDDAELARRLVEAQERALEALRLAALPEPGDPLSRAMVHEQEAYTLLKKLEPERTSVQQTRSEGRNQGQEPSGSRRELDQLDLARNRNFYEEQDSVLPPDRRATEQNRQALADLTKRQQMANEEMGRLISELLQAGTAEEREEIQRRLKRLEEELQRNIERLDELTGEMASGAMDQQQARETQGGLNQARGEMSRSLEAVREAQLQQARAAGSRAADALDQAQRGLAGLSNDAAAAGLNSLRKNMAQLEERQKSILDRLDELRKRAAENPLDDLDTQENAQASLVEDKRSLANEMKQHLEEAGTLAEGTQQNQALMSRKLNDWLRETSGTGLLDTMREAERMVEAGLLVRATDQEQQVLDNLASANRKLGEIERYLVSGEEDALRLALEQVRGLLETPPREPAQAREGDAETDRPRHETPQATQIDTQNGDNQIPAESANPQRPSRQRAQGPSNETADTASERTPQDARGPGGFGPEDLERFVNRDYTRWLDAIRNAEALVTQELTAPTGNPDGPDPRRELSRAREAIGDMRRDYRGSGVASRYEAFVERVVTPLEQAALGLDERLKELLLPGEFNLEQRVDVPSQYKERVAEYFKALSEAEVNRQ